MNIFIEFIGYPGAGKTLFSRKLIKNFNKKKIKIIKSDKYFFDYYSTNLLNKLFLKSFYEYKKKMKFESNFIFKTEYKYLKKKLNFLIKKNKLNPAIRNFNSLLQLTDLNNFSKKTSIDNFKIDLCSFYLDRNKNYNIYNDEGLIQKVYQLYKKNVKINVLESRINKYLRSVPLPNIVIIVDTNFNKSVKNSFIRDKGFKYNFKNINETRKIFNKINLHLKIKLKNKTNLFVVKNLRQFDRKLKNFEKNI